MVRDSFIPKYYDLEFSHFSRFTVTLDSSGELGAPSNADDFFGLLSPLVDFRLILVPFLPFSFFRVRVVNVAVVVILSISV